MKAALSVYLLIAALFYLFGIINERFLTPRSILSILIGSLLWPVVVIVAAAEAIRRR